MTQNWDRSRVKSADILRPAAPQQPSVSVAIPCALSTPRHGHYPELAAELFSVGIAVRDERLFLHLLLLLILLASWGHHRLSAPWRGSRIPELVFPALVAPLAASYVHVIISDRDEPREQPQPQPPRRACAAPWRAAPRHAAPRHATPRYAAERQRRTRRTVDVLSGRARSASGKNGGQRNDAICG